MNVDWDMAGSWRVLVLGLSALISRNCARSVHSELCEHRYHVSCFIQLVKIGINTQLDMADGSKVFVSGSCKRSAHNRAQSVGSELCKHRYRVSCFIQLLKLA